MSSCRLVGVVEKATLFLAASLERSLVLRAIGTGAAFIEKSFQHSTLSALAEHLLRLYPARVYAVVDRVNMALPRAELSPALLFPITYLLFLSLGKMSLLSFSLVVLFLISFVLAFSLASRIEVERVAFEKSSLKLGLMMLLISLLALCLDLYRAYDVPLLEPQARVKLSVAYTYLATFLVPGAVLLAALLGKQYIKGRLSTREARVYTFAIALTTIFLVSLLGYRTQSVVSLLAFTFVMHRYRIIGMAEILAALAGVLLAVTALGYYRALVMGSEVSFMEVIGRRVELTITLYDYTVNNLHSAGVTTLLFGYYRGDIALATFSSFLDFVPGFSLGPRTIVARNFGVTGVSLTSTLLGTVSLDLGVVGVVTFALALGSILGAAYALAKRTSSALATALYSVCFAYLLVGIETGLVDFNVFVLYSFTAFVALASIARMER
jgi:oligosaccharide repeat unit polymerase